MHAEIDDDPRFQLREKESPWRMFAISLASVAVIWAGVGIFAKQTAVNANQVNTTPQLAIQQEASTAQGSINRQTVEYVEPQRTAYAAPIATHSYSIERTPATTEPTPKPARQTSFNDQNYSGGRTINTISLNEPMEFEEPEVKKPGKVRVTVVGEKTRVRDYCPLRTGSIENRNCRQSVGLSIRD